MRLLSLSFPLALAPSYTFQGKVEEKRYTYIVEDFRFSINEVCRLVRIIFPREIACCCCEGVFTTSTLLTPSPKLHQLPPRASTPWLPPFGLSSPLPLHLRRPQQSIFAASFPSLCLSSTVEMHKIL